MPMNDLPASSAFFKDRRPQTTTVEVPAVRVAGDSVFKVAYAILPATCTLTSDELSILSEFDGHQPGICRPLAAGSEVRVV